MTAGGDRADEDTIVRTMFAHPDAVAENSAARYGARGINGDNRDALTACQKPAEERVDQCRLASPRGAGDAKYVRASEMRSNCQRNGTGGRIAVFDRADGARDCTPIASKDRRN